jgi:hypothetical protein
MMLLGPACSSAAHLKHGTAFQDHGELGRAVPVESSVHRTAAQNLYTNNVDYDDCTPLEHLAQRWPSLLQATFQRVRTC